MAHCPSYCPLKRNEERESEISTVINVFWSNEGLISGRLSQCLDPTNITDATCEGGLASVAAVIRTSRARGDGPALFFPIIERTTRFVQVCKVTLMDVSPYILCIVFASSKTKILL